MEMLEKFSFHFLFELNSSCDQTEQRKTRQTLEFCFYSFEFLRFIEQLLEHRFHFRWDLIFLSELFDETKTKILFERKRKISFFSLCFAPILAVFGATRSFLRSSNRLSARWSSNVERRISLRLIFLVVRTPLRDGTKIFDRRPWIPTLKFSTNFRWESSTLRN